MAGIFAVEVEYKSICDSTKGGWIQNSEIFSYGNCKRNPFNSTGSKYLLPKLKDCIPFGVGYHTQIYT